MALWVHGLTWLPSLVVRSFFHQEDNQTLKSPVTNIKLGFWLILSDISGSDWSEDAKKIKNSKFNQFYIISLFYIYKHKKHYWTTSKHL